MTEGLELDFWAEARSPKHRRAEAPFEGSGQERVLNLLEGTSAHEAVSLIVRLALAAPKDGFALTVLGAGFLDALLEHHGDAAAVPLAAAAAEHAQVAEALKATVPTGLTPSGLRRLRPWLR